MVTVVALSGAVAVGKTTLAKALVERWGGVVLSTRKVIQERAECANASSNRRKDLQAFGKYLDQETAGEWVASAVKELGLVEGRLIVVDAVRIEAQLVALRESFGRTLVHVHLEGTDRAALASRYEQRSHNVAGVAEFDTYEEAVANEPESATGALADHADVVIDTLRNDEVDLLVRCEARLGLLPSLTVPLVDVLVGGQYGSEGKGNIAFYLAPEYDLLVRVGGPNAGHKVKHEGQIYTHRSLPSGALSNPLAKLVIGPGAVLSYQVLKQELEETGVDPRRVHIDPQAMVITDNDILAEASLRTAIQSTGEGVGVATARRILDRATSEPKLAGDLAEFREFVSPTAELLNKAFEEGGRVLVEGTQGTGLSLYHGQYPFVTSRDTTVGSVLAETGIGPRRVRRVILAIRTYPIRVHGASGPIGRGEDISWKEIESRSGVEDAAVSEFSSVTKKKRRVAEFDWAMLRRSAELNSATDIALTFTDYIDAKNRTAYRYEQLSPATLKFVEEVESVSGAAASLIATSFSERNIIDRRTWRGNR